MGIVNSSTNINRNLPIVTIQILKGKFSKVKLEFFYRFLLRTKVLLPFVEFSGPASRETDGKKITVLGSQI